MAKNGTLNNSSGSSSATASADAQPSSYNYPCTISQSTPYCVGYLSTYFYLGTYFFVGMHLYTRTHFNLRLVLPTYDLFAFLT